MKIQWNIVTDSNLGGRPRRTEMGSRFPNVIRTISITIPLTGGGGGSELNLSNMISAVGSYMETPTVVLTYKMDRSVKNPHNFLWLSCSLSRSLSSCKSIDRTI